MVGLFCRHAPFPFLLSRTKSNCSPKLSPQMGKMKEKKKKRDEYTWTNWMVETSTRACFFLNFTWTQPFCSKCWTFENFCLIRFRERNGWTFRRTAKIMRFPRHRVCHLLGCPVRIVGMKNATNNRGHVLWLQK